MKKLKKLLLLSLSLVIMLSFSLSAFAQAKISPRWNYLISMSADLDINSLGVANVDVYCIANKSTIDSMKATIAVQRLENGSWKTVKSWSTSEDGSTINFNKNCAVYKNYSYRVKVTAKAYSNGSLKETVTQDFDFGYYN